MLLLLLFLAVTVDAVFLPLYSYHKAQCFLTKNVVAGGVVSGSYEISGSNEDVAVWSSRLLADHFKYTAAAPGQYNLCFKQTYNRGRQTASFQIHVSGDTEYYDDPSSNIASKGQTEKVGNLAKQIETQSMDLLDHQDYSITREAIHRETSESTNSRVLWWSLAQMAVIITLSVVQMYYIKSFFEIKLIV